MYSLYVKTHKETGLKYLGFTSKDPFNYIGSGLYWRRHLKKYGCSIDTEVIFESDNMSAIKELGRYYSNLWNIVDSQEWANLKPEDGVGGTWKGLHGKDNPMYGTTRPEYIKEAIRKSNTGKKNEYLSTLNRSRKGIPRSQEVKDKISATKKKVK